MELNLKTSKKTRPLISKISFHNDKGEPLFEIIYDLVEENLVFEELNQSQILDKLIMAKTSLSEAKGVESYGSIISGSDEQYPIYTHLLSLYLPGKEKEFEKIHATLETQLENLDFQNSLFLAVETYAVVFQLLKKYLKNDTKEIELNSLLTGYFRRDYSIGTPFQLLFENKELNGSELSNTTIIKQSKAIDNVLEKHKENVKGVSIYFLTLSGAIMGQKRILGNNLNRQTLHNLTHNAILHPGVFSNSETLSFWFPFTSNRIGRIKRAIQNILTSIQYANVEQNRQDQVQTNIAYKFQDLLEAMVEEKFGDMGLLVNPGNLVCTIEFSKQIRNQLNKILPITNEINQAVRAYGQSILTHISKNKAFKPLR